MCRAFCFQVRPERPGVRISILLSANKNTSFAGPSFLPGWLPQRGRRLGWGLFHSERGRGEPHSEARWSFFHALWRVRKNLGNCMAWERSKKKPAGGHGAILPGASLLKVSFPPSHAFLRSRLLTLPAIECEDFYEALADAGVSGVKCDGQFLPEAHAALHHDHLALLFDSRTGSGRGAAGCKAGPDAGSPIWAGMHRIGTATLFLLLKA